MEPRPPDSPEVVGDAPDGLLVVDGQGTIRYANPIAQELFGRRDLVGSDFGLPLAGERTEVELVAGQGEQRVVEMRARPATWTDEPVTIVWLHDVTGLVGRQRELTARLASLEAMLSTVAHEVRGPITAARNLVELTGGADAEEDDRNRRAALRNLRHAEEVLSDLVKPGAERGVDDVELIELWSVIASASDGVIHRDLAIELRGPVDRLRVRARRRHVDQILRNLLTNAVTYGAPPIAIDVASVGREVVIRVTDRGPGVSEELEPRLFTRYAVGHDQGTGLGLAIVRSLAESNGGSVAYLRGQTGACFEVRLPEG